MLLFTFKYLLLNCLPVVQEHQVAQVDHLLHFLHLFLGPHFVPEGPYDPSGPIKKENYQWTYVLLYRGSTLALCTTVW